MKKIIALLLTLALMFTMSINCFATFVQSPSNNGAPVIIDDETMNESEDCDADIIITPYAERDTLSAEAKAKIEEAYAEISDSLHSAELCDELAAYCKKNNIDAENLQISDLFDISYEGCTDHHEHGSFIITFKADTLANFVALLHLTDNGWDMIENAKVVRDGTALKFKVDDFSPFAIVVDTSEDASSPSTGDNSNITMWIVILAACVVALGTTLFFIFKRKKA